MTNTLVYFGTILAGSTVTIFNNFAMTCCSGPSETGTCAAGFYDRFVGGQYCAGIFNLHLLLAWRVERRFATVLAQVVSAPLLFGIYPARRRTASGVKQTGGQMGVLLGALVGAPCR